MGGRRVNVVNASHHWEAVYGEKAVDAVSWYESEPATSLRLITSLARPADCVLDVGAGASSLLLHLIRQGYSCLTGLDVSARALAIMRGQFDGGTAPELVAADIANWDPPQRYQVWHDRAVFHFMAPGPARSSYLETMAAGVVAGGHVIIATFASDGPTHCSGLEVQRYDADELVTLLAPWCDEVARERTEHVTPWGAVQPFTWVIARRR